MQLLTYTLDILHSPSGLFWIVGFFILLVINAFLFSELVNVRHDVDELKKKLSSGTDAAILYPGALQSPVNVKIKFKSLNDEIRN